MFARFSCAVPFFICLRFPTDRRVYDDFYSQMRHDLITDEMWDNISSNRDIWTLEHLRCTLTPFLHICIWMVVYANPRHKCKCTRPQRGDYVQEWKTVGYRAANHFIATRLSRPGHPGWSSRRQICIIVIISDYTGYCSAKFRCDFTLPSISFQCGFPANNFNPSTPRLQHNKSAIKIER